MLFFMLEKSRGDKQLETHVQRCSFALRSLLKPVPIGAQHSCRGTVIPFVML